MNCGMPYVESMTYDCLDRPIYLQCSVRLSFSLHCLLLFVGAVYSLLMKGSCDICLQENRVECMDEQCVVNLTDIKPADMLSIRTCFLSDKHCSMHQWCIVGCLSNIKHQDYVYMKGEYSSTWQKYSTIWDVKRRHGICEMDLLNYWLGKCWPAVKQAQQTRITAPPVRCNMEQK